MNKILGIDPGTQCGWAVREEGAVDFVGWTSGTWDLAARRHEGGGMRFVRLRNYMNNLIDTFKPNAVVYEEVRRHMSTDAAHVYGGIIAIIAELCETRGIPYKGIPVGTVKKVATGKGNSGKPEMMAAAKSRWPGWDGDDNEADARFIAETGWKELYS